MAAHRYFEKTVKSNSGELSLTADMLRLLVAIKPDRDILKIAAEAGMGTAALKEILARLLKAGLVRPAQAAVVSYSPRFLEIVAGHLANFVGPMAQIIIEDVLADLDISGNQVPKHLAAQFVSTVAEEIPEPEQQVQFKKTMVAILSK